jgi:hypothetical protein
MLIVRNSRNMVLSHKHLLGYNTVPKASDDRLTWENQPRWHWKWHCQFLHDPSSMVFWGRENHLCQTWNICSYEKGHLPLQWNTQKHVKSFRGKQSAPNCKNNWCNHNKGNFNDDPSRSGLLPSLANTVDPYLWSVSLIGSIFQLKMHGILE